MLTTDAPSLVQSASDEYVEVDAIEARLQDLDGRLDFCTHSPFFFVR